MVFSLCCFINSVFYESNKNPPFFFLKWFKFEALMNMHELFKTSCERFFMVRSYKNDLDADPGTGENLPYWVNKNIINGTFQLLLNKNNIFQCI